MYAKRENWAKSQGFYKKQVWLRIRKLVLQRDNYLCQGCLGSGKITRAKEIHHIKPINEYPELALNLDNLTSLCHGCHDATKQRQPISTAPPTSQRTYAARVIRIGDGSEEVNVDKG